MASAAIIVVGGAARRLGGIAKPWISVRGRPIVDWVVDAARGHVDEVVLVGTPPEQWSRPDVRWTCEEPTGAGPVAAVSAGITGIGDDIEEILLLTGDAPFIEQPLRLLFSAAITADGVAIHSGGRVQFLCARVKRNALQTALTTASTSMRSVFASLRITEIEAEVVDADTWEDIARLRQEQQMDEWLEAVAEKLGIAPAVDIDAVLDLTRDVAHSRERKYAPLTSYLLGYAAASKQLHPAQIAALAAELGAMAKDHA